MWDSGFFFAFLGHWVTAGATGGGPAGSEGHRRYRVSRRGYNGQRDSDSPGLCRCEIFLIFH